MGLDTSHNCWHGAYSAFMRWRREVAKLAGLPPLELMEGFFDEVSAINNPFFETHKAECSQGFNVNSPESIWKRLPIKWEALKPSALHILLYHSDCDGEIKWQDCNAIADALETVCVKMKDEDAGGHIGHWKAKTRQFVDGLRLAASNHENIEFH